MTDTVRCDRDGGVATITLNRPDARNALTAEMKEGLLAALRDCGAESGVRAVILTGAGRAFCAGQDLREHAGLLAAGAEPAGPAPRWPSPAISVSPRAGPAC